MALKPVTASAAGLAARAGAASNGEVSYRSSQWMLALWLILPPNTALVAALTWPTPLPLWVKLLALGVPLLILLLFGRLVIELRGSLLRWRYGFVGWPRWHLALDEITEIKLTRGSLAHAGIQFKGRQRVFTASLGGPALALSLRDGRSVLLRSPEPDRLAQFIRARLPDRR